VLLLLTVLYVVCTGEVPTGLEQVQAGRRTGGRAAGSQPGQGRVSKWERTR